MTQKDLFQYEQTMSQKAYFDREIRRQEVNKKLACLRKEAASCFNCASFHNPSILISVCRIKQDKQVKFYNLCENWKEKQS